MTIGRDAQPDIYYQGDELRRKRDSFTSRVDGWTRQIRMELQAIKNRPGNPVFAGKARAWIAYAQAERRQALHNAQAYEMLIAERDMQRRLVG